MVAGLAVSLLFLKLSVTPVTFTIFGGMCGGSVTLDWDSKISKIEYNDCSGIILVGPQNITTPNLNIPITNGGLIDERVKTY